MSERDAPENLKCPICFEVPANKVFQCKDGHIICDHCYFQVTHCPQCRTPFIGNPIRCRAIEGMITDLRLTGWNPGYGRTGPSRDICKLFGYSDCFFIANGNNTDEVIDHLKTAHSLQAFELDYHFKIIYGDLESFASSTICGENKKWIWGPGIAYERSKHCLMFFHMKYNSDDKTLSWTPYFLPFRYGMQLEPPHVEFTISGSEFINTKALKFTLPAVDILRVGGSGLNATIPAVTLLKDYEIFSKICIKIRVL